MLIQRYLRALEADPRESFAFQRLLDLYRERDGNIDALVGDLERRRAAEPTAYPPVMLLGHIYKAQSRNDDALRAYDEATRLRPHATPPLLALAAMATRANDHARARELLERALEHTRDEPGRQELLRQLGVAALAQDDFDGARQYYERLVRGARGSVFLRTEFARALSERNQHRRAVEEYQRVLGDLRGDNRVAAPVLREMGRAQLDAGDANAAIATLERALRLAGQQAGVRQEIYDTLVDAYRRGERLPELAERLVRGGGGFETAELLGRIRDELGQETEALAAYRRALSMNPRHIDTRVRVVQLLSRSGRIDEVIREYEALIRAAPREPRFVVELAQLLMQVGRRADALRMAQQTSRRYPTEPSVHQALAELYGRWGEDGLATAEIATLTRIEPSDPAHLIALGEQQLEAGNRDAAMATWRRILSSSMDGAVAHATLGGVYADHDFLDEARRQYGEAVRLDDSRLEYVRGLASVLERMHRDDDAITEWQRVLALSGEDRIAKREARQRVVAIWSRARQLPHHIARLERDFAQDPPDLEAGRFLAEAYRRQGARTAVRAEETLARIIALAPGDLESLLSLERLRAARGDVAGAIEVLQRLVDADPRRASQYLQRMAEHALSLYRDEEAVRYAAMVVERTPDDANGHRRLGDLYRARQDTEAAIRSYERAIELNDRLFATYFDLAEIHVARGQLEEADRLFRTVMRTCPDDDFVARAARASIQINMGAGTLEALERELLPLALGHPQRPVFRRLVVELYDAYAGPLVQAQQRGDVEARTTLSGLGTRALKPLLEALADADPNQRRVAVGILGHLGNPNAALPLLAAAESDGDIEVRVRALLAAGAVADSSLAPRFAAVAAGTERRMRPPAAWALARMGGRAAIASLRELLDAGDPNVRAFAAMGLGRAGDRASAGDLEERLRQERSAEVQAAAAWALGQLRDPTRIPALVATLRGRSGLAALAAAHALGHLGAPDARSALCRALFDTDPRQRRAAAAALLRLVEVAPPGQRDLPVLTIDQGAADYLSVLTQEADGQAARPVDLEPLMESLISAATDGLRGPSEQALSVLDVLGSGEGGLGLGPISARLQEWPESARRAAEAHLLTLGQALLPELDRVARHPEPRVRAAAVRLLGTLPDSGATAALVRALDDEEAEVTHAALSVFSPRHVIEDPALVGRIATISATARDWSTRMRAAEGLGRLQTPAAIPALAAALADDRYAFVRETAARALGGIGDVAGIEPLGDALRTDTEPRVRRAAARALAHIDDARARRLLRDARRPVIR